MKIKVCIGSSCHLKGSRIVVEALQNLIKENNLADVVELSGTFCLGRCQEGVCVMVDNKSFSLTSLNTESFFKEEILSRI